MLLDLDGTLLDLAFDNDFWRQLVPQAWARAARDRRWNRRGPNCGRASPPARARSTGTASSTGAASCELDIRALKREAAHDIRWLPGAREFLQRVRALGKRLVLITNAHPTTLAIKDERTEVISYFDAGFSSHTLRRAEGGSALLARTGQGRALRSGPQPVRRRQPAACCAPRARRAWR